MLWYGIAAGPLLHVHALHWAQAFVYMAGLQLLLSAPQQALLGTVMGAAVGAAQRCNLLGLRDLRVGTPPPCAAPPCESALGSLSR